MVEKGERVFFALWDAFICKKQLITWAFRSWNCNRTTRICTMLHVL